MPGQADRNSHVLWMPKRQLQTGWESQSQRAPESPLRREQMWPKETDGRRRAVTPESWHFRPAALVPKVRSCLTEPVPLLPCGQSTWGELCWPAYWTLIPWTHRGMQQVWVLGSHWWQLYLMRRLACCLNNKPWRFRRWELSSMLLSNNTLRDLARSFNLCKTVIRHECWALKWLANIFLSKSPCFSAWSAVPMILKGDRIPWLLFAFLLRHRHAPGLSSNTHVLEGIPQQLVSYPRT